MYFAFVLVFILFAPSLALAEAEAHAGGHHAAGLSTLLWPAANFVLYAGLLLFCYLKYIRKILSERSVKVDEHLKKSAKSLSDAQTQLKELQQRIEGIAGEKEKLNTQYQHEGEKTSVSIREQAEKSAIDIKNDTERRISGELKRATSEVRQEVVKQAVFLARQRLARELTDENDERLRQEALRGFVS